MKSALSFNAYCVDIILHRFFSAINAPLTILDFGCGDGLKLHYIQQAFAHASCWGIDINASIIDNNQAEYPELSFVAHKNGPLPFENQTFDLIYCVNVMHHVDEKDRSMIIAELLRILKPSGSLLIVENNPYALTMKKASHDYEEQCNSIPARSIKNIFNKSPSYVQVSYLYPSLPLKYAKLNMIAAKIPFGPLYCIEIKKGAW